MRHLKKGKKFNRKKGQRKALFKSLMNNLILKEKIETTEAKAKEIKPKTEKMITLGKKQDLASLRLLISRLNKKAAEKVYYNLAPRYKKKRGGYTRIIKTSKQRVKDGAKMVIIEFV
ncbi:50S ribosomal protein L17 [Candidatus Wolfebacteria bacterium]|nr:50S ribosomal protein L17 [Candidatus Wolfebacteria bacterium]